MKAEDAPKSHDDLLDPKWRGRIVKAHPGYSGTIMTGTHALSDALGWDFFEKLGKQRVMQVQSSTEPPKKLAQGERSIMADGNEYNVFVLKEDGVPIEIVYAVEGTPARDRQRRHPEERAEPERGEALLRLPVLARTRSSSSATSAACAPSIPR